MIDTALHLAWLGLLACTAFGALFLGAAATNIRRARRREALRLPKDVDTAGDSLARRVISDRHHPLYCHGARRGPEAPGQTLARRFR